MKLKQLRTGYPRPRGSYDRSAISDTSAARSILEESLQPKPHNNERLLDRLVEVLERPDIVVAVLVCGAVAIANARAATTAPLFSAVRTSVLKLTVAVVGSRSMKLRTSPASLTVVAATARALNLVRMPHRLPE